MTLRTSTIKFAILCILVIDLPACAGTGAGISQTWSLIEVVTKGDRIDTFVDIVEVQNCGIVQPKTITCSAGTNNDLSVSLGGEMGEGFTVTGEVSSTLGIGRQSGEEVQLEVPPDGYVYRFSVKKEYRVAAGELLARSPAGEQIQTSYTFNATCSLQVVSKEEFSCGEANQPFDNLDAPGENWRSDIQEPHVYEQFVMVDEAYDSFSYAADIQINNDASEYHGLMFGLQSNDKNFYSFRITPDGQFAIDLWKESPDSSFTRLLGPLRSDAIHPGANAQNRLRVNAHQGTFDFYINDQRVGAITDHTFTHGKFGFISCTCDGTSSASATFLNTVLEPNP